MFGLLYSYDGYKLYKIRYSSQNICGNNKYGFLFVGKYETSPVYEDIYEIIDVK